MVKILNDLRCLKDQILRELKIEELFNIPIHEINQTIFQIIVIANTKSKILKTPKKQNWMLEISKEKKYPMIKIIKTPEWYASKWLISKWQDFIKYLEECNLNNQVVNY